MLFAKRALAASLQVLGAQAATVWPGHEAYPLGLLDGSDGFRVTAESSTGRLGYSVSGAGDINNDGYNDVILGESPELTTTAGAAYVIFGSESFTAVSLDVSTLDGTNGFKIQGTDAGDFAGTAVAGAGDVNGDGYDDVMVGAWGASSAAGEIMVVFGAATFSAVVSVTDLDGSAGFVMLGATTSDAAGFSLAAAGDVNNDGAGDMIVGAYQADPSGSMSGEAYIIFGSLTWTQSLLGLGALGSGGLTLQGAERRDYVGHSVAGVGDVNDDGYSDVIISAHGANEAYVFYGAASFSQDVYALNTLSGSDGFIISVGNEEDEIFLAGAGDMNNDDYGDIAIGHSLADPTNGGGNSAGATYVILGGGAIPSPLDVLVDLDGSNGFVLEGGSEGDRSGTSVSNAGDINQDGYGDLVIGAPGVGNDVGSAFVVFGGAAFSEGSYTLGAIGAEGSYTLIAPSDDGLGGFSVAGAGDVNQDGFPDLVVGAHGSGTAGEAFVVFPGLTGTPPPTMTPTPAPTGPTPSPLSREEGATPAPTVNFLVQGVVGGGTVYDSPGVFIRAQELGGEVSLGADRWFDQDTSVSFALESLHEKDADGSLVGLGAAVPHVVDGGGLVYEATATTNVTVQGVAAQESTMTAPALGGETSVTIIMQVFEEDGVLTTGDEQTEVSVGTLKVSVAVTDWPFCDPATAPTRSTQDTPSTVCSGASSTLETGAFLDAMLVVQGPSQAQPEQQQSSDGDGDSEDGAVYGLVGASADATLVMSEWVSTDDNGWTKSDEMSLSGSTFTVRFPASSGTLMYDPTLELTLIADNGEDEFWRKAWFIWTAASLGVLILICLIGGTMSRKRRADKDKVSPGFEGVAPAVDPGGPANDDGTVSRGRRLRGILVRTLSSCCCFWRKAGQSTKKAQTGTAAAVGKIYAPRLRWRRKGSAVANHAAAGTANKRGSGDDTADAAPSSSAGAAGAAPDWIQGLSGGGGEAPAESDGGGGAATTGVPDWLADVAGPAASAAPAANADQTADGAPAGVGYDDGYYGQGYEGYEYGGYEGYEGYGGYEGYEAYGDGYGYDYYNSGYGGGEAGQGAQGVETAGGGGATPAATPPPVAADTGGAAASGGGGLSWLTNAASTVNTLNQDDED